MDEINELFFYNNHLTFIEMDAYLYVRIVMTFRVECHRLVQKFSTVENITKTSHV
jgi:hypothetical protein